MIHSDNESVLEDYWYSDGKCQVSNGESYPCEEIYFIKNTDIPLRTVRVEPYENMVRKTTQYTVMSIGKPDEKLFEPIPIDWAYSCPDSTQGIVYSPQRLELKVNESVTIEMYLTAPPHRINGNNSVILEFELDPCTPCDHCFRWTPNRFVFNTDNFRQPQNLTISRVKTGGVILNPNFTGGGYEHVTTPNYDTFID